jgi:hypothetical protein
MKIKMRVIIAYRLAKPLSPTGCEAPRSPRPDPGLDGHQLGVRLSRLGQDDLLAAVGALQQARQVGLRVVYVDDFTNLMFAGGAWMERTKSLD